MKATTQTSKPALEPSEPFSLAAVGSNRQATNLAELITAVSTHLINLAPDDIDTGISNVLSLLGQYTQAERSIVVLQDNQLLTSTHEWRAPDIPADRNTLQEIEASSLAWILTQLNKSNIIHIPSINHLPPEATNEKELFINQGLQSFVAVPLTYQNVQLGLLGLFTITRQHTWSAEDISLLQIVGELFTNALQRKEFEEREKLAYKIGAELVSILDQDMLLNVTINQLCDSFGYYYAQIFLLNNLFPDQDKTQPTHLIIQAGTGTVGERLIQRRHAIDIHAPRSVVARAARTQETVCVDDVRQTTYHLPNPVLPKTRSELAIPLINEQALIGVLDVQHTNPSHFTDHETRILQIIANQLSIALAKATLFARNQRLLEELTLLQAIATVAAEATDEDTLFTRVTHIVVQALHTDHFGFAFLDPESGNLTYHPSTWNHDKKIMVNLIRPGEGVCWQVISSGRSRRYADVTQEPAFIGDPLVRSELCVPLKLNRKVIGVLNAESMTVNAFSEANERLLLTIAEQLATTIEKLRLFEKAQHQAAETAALLATSKAISSLKLDHVLNTIATEAQKLFKADTCRIHLLEPDGIILRCVVAISDQPDHAILNFTQGVGVGITGRVALSGLPEIIRNTLDDGQGIQIPGTPTEDEAMALAPLVIRKKVIGVMTVTRRDITNQFTQTNLQLLIAFADQAAVAIDNARLFAVEQQRARRQQHLANTAGALLNARSLSELGPTITAVAQQTLDVDRIAIYLYDAARKSLRCLYAHNLSTTYTDALSQFYRTMPGAKLLNNAQPITVDDALDDYRTASLRDVISTEGFRSYAVFSMSIPGDPVGALTFYRDHVAPFNSDDLVTGQTLTYIVSIAYQNILLLTEIRQALEREQRLNDISRTLNTAPDLPTVLAYVARLATDLLDADAGLVGLVIDHQIVTFYPYNIPPSVSLRPVTKGSGIAWEIIETGQSVIHAHYQDHPKAQQKLIKVGVGAFIGVPIVAGDECLGALQIFSFTPGRQFSRRDLALAESIGQQAGIAMQNRRLFSQLSERAEALAISLARQEELDEAKNEFIQNVSHELRTPLGLIYGYAELLDSGGLGELEPAQKQSMDIIVKRVRMLINMLEDMSALLAAETQDFRREEIDPAALLRTVQEEYRLQAEKAGVSLEVTTTSTMPLIVGDPFHLRRVFDNLLSNAFKFTPAGGAISLRAWTVGREVLIEVSDTGTGIAEEEMQRIFERFYRANSGSAQHHMGKGTGLGLALVKEIVEAHRGKITVRSVLGQGTTFQIHLPGAD